MERDKVKLAYCIAGEPFVVSLNTFAAARTLDRFLESEYKDEGYVSKLIYDNESGEVQ